MSGLALSVLITSKNRPDRVERLVRSIRTQDFREPIEIIVVDDSSTPPIQLTDSDVKLVRNDTNIGACASRNRGFSMALGEFVGLFDDDTELFDPATLSRAIDLARANPEFAAIGFRHLLPDGTPNKFQPADSSVTCETAYFYGYGVLFRRDAVMQTSGFETTFGYGYEEQDLCMQLHQAGWRVMFAPELTLLHHQDERERDWTRVHRRISRNAIRSMMLRFPTVSVVPCVTAKWLSFFLETRRRGKTDWSGGFEMFFDTLRYVPYAWRHRQPMAAKQLVRFKRLRSHPQPLVQLQPAVA